MMKRQFQEHSQIVVFLFFFGLFVVIAQVHSARVSTEDILGLHSNRYWSRFGRGKPDVDDSAAKGLPRGALSFRRTQGQTNLVSVRIRGGEVDGIKPDPLLKPTASSPTSGASYGGTFRSAADSYTSYRASASQGNKQYAARSWDYYQRKTAFNKKKSHQSFLEPLNIWWNNHIVPNFKNFPKVQCRVEPTTTLKIRKTFRPLGTVVQLGADFNTQLGVWQFKSSWEDALIGGKLTLAGRELQFSKSWPLSVGAMEDLVTRLRLRAAIDLQTWKAYARVGFRTERLIPINVSEGFTVQRQIPLDGNKGHVKLQVKANFALPEPEIEYSTESQRSLIGMGDIQINIEELNLLLDY